MMTFRFSKTQLADDFGIPAVIGGVLMIGIGLYGMAAFPVVCSGLVIAGVVLLVGGAAATCHVMWTNKDDDTDLP